MNILKTVRTMKILKAFLWIIVISFVAAMFTVWGGGGDVTKAGKSLFGSDYAVKVGSDSLPPGAFRLQYRQYAERIRSMLGDQFRDDFLRGAPQNVANQMASGLIAARLAKTYGLTVSDEELAAGIQRAFQFRDPRTEYPAALSRMGVTASEFEPLFRNELLVQKLVDLLADSAYIPQKELEARYVKQNEKVKATVVLVSPNAFRAQAGVPTEAEILARYDREKATLVTPEKRTLEILSVGPAQLRSELKPSDADVRAYYQSHIADYSIPKDQRRASHILIKVPEGAKPAEVDAARKKAEEIYQKVKAGGDFAALAKEYSQDSSAQNGGDLGWFGRAMMVKPFADAVFDQCKAVGDVVGPVQSQFGFHIIKLTGIGGAAKPFDEVKDQVRQTMLLKDPKYAGQVDALFAQAKKDLEAAKDDAAMKAAADKYHVKIADLKSVTKDQPLGMLGRDAAAADVAFALPKGQWSPVLKARDGIARVKVTEIAPAHPATLEEVRGKLAQEIMKDKAIALARVAAASLVQSAKDAASLEAAAKKDNLRTQDTGEIAAGANIPGVGRSEAFEKALMAAGVGQAVGPVETPQGWAVGLVTEHKAADMKAFEKDRASFDASERQKDAEQVLEDYIAQERKSLEARKEILFNADLIKQMEPAAGQQG